ncbi:MAG: hypothetical protein AAF830_14755 [Pseudomonadota bacterium]
MACAVFDLGKSTMRLTVVLEDESAAFQTRAATPEPLNGPYRALDLSTIEAWLLSALKQAAATTAVRDIIVTAHGAAIAAIDPHGQLSAPVMDYEWDAAEAAPAYDDTRPSFAETGSPRLPLGLNLGRQLAVMDDGFPAEATFLPLPQYIAFLLSGERSSEISSLGCHTDLWAPYQRRWSSLSARRGWAERFAPRIEAQETLGRVRTEVVAATGLDPRCRVRCGAHDSNAALVPYLDQDTAVLSTGTWFIAMVPGGSGEGLDEERDCLVGCDVTGRPVPTARFMGGREYALAAGAKPHTSTWDDVERVLGSNLFVLPSLTNSGGPFPDRKGDLTEEAAEAADRAAAASLYTALMAQTCLSLLPATEGITVEGPAATDIFCGCLAAFFPERSIERVEGGGATYGAARLAMPGITPPEAETVPPPPLSNEIRAYADRWQERLAG